MKKRPELIIIIPIIVIVGLLIINSISHRRTINTVISSDEEMLSAMTAAVLDNKRVVKFKSSICPSESVMNDLFPRVLESDAYIGGELHHYQYIYKGPDYHGMYEVKFKLSKPGKIASTLSKIRAKQIARHLNKELKTDYEKVKAVHDYLVLLNKYSYIKGGAFACMYLRSSACNGYAYSFNEIMKELNIPSVCVFGQNHVWNMVEIEGEWYNIDVTWDDVGGRNPSYEYFLKCDEDWVGHAYTGATATSSLEPTGLTARQNYNLIPPYHLFMYAFFILLAVAIVFGFRAFIRYLNQKELKEIQERLEREELARKLFEEQIKKKQEEFSKEDHSIW